MMCPDYKICNHFLAWNYRNWYWTEWSVSLFQDFNSSYGDLIKKTGTTTLHLSRLRIPAIETFKIAYGLSPQYLNEFIRFKDSTLYNFRYSNLFEIARTKSTRYGTNSFRYQAAKLWNSLPDGARIVTSFNNFKHFIKAWNSVFCKCASCK